MSERLYNNKGAVVSGLVTGTQWDMMIKYMQDNGVATKGEECNWGNYDNTQIDSLTGYYTKIDQSTLYTDEAGFKSCSDLENQSTADKGDALILLATGASEKVKKMNIYDVAGNLQEWTDEAAYNYEGSTTTLLSDKEYNTFICRGGTAWSYCMNLPACSRNGVTALNSYIWNGFRVVLYIK